MRQCLLRYGLALVSLGMDQKRVHTELFEEIFFESVNESEIFRTMHIQNICIKHLSFIYSFDDKYLFSEFSKIKFNIIIIITVVTSE